MTDQTVSKPVPRSRLFLAMVPAVIVLLIYPFLYFYCSGHRVFLQTLRCFPKGWPQDIWVPMAWIEAKYTQRPVLIWVDGTKGPGRVVQ